LIESIDEHALRHVETGRPVSIDARSVRRDDNELTHVRRNTLARLDAIAILEDDGGEVPIDRDAKIERVRELSAHPRGADVPSAAPPVTGGTIRLEGIGQVLGLR
jgi:hypothetical protein